MNNTPNESGHGLWARWRAAVTIEGVVVGLLVEGIVVAALIAADVLRT